MKRIGILTFHFSNSNYGAVLQAAALQAYLKSLGHRVETIDFIPNHDSNKSSLRLFLRAIKRQVKQLLYPDKNFTIFNDKIFEEFRNLWLRRSDNQYRTVEELNSAGFDYDAFIVGSDQVWQPKYTRECYPAYFLSFVPDNAKKISYASSFGTESWEYLENEALTLTVQNLLNNFDAISVREKGGKIICRETFNLSSGVVLDPTLLVGRDFFEKIIGNKVCDNTQKKIVYYKLDIDDDFNRALENVSTQLNLPVENIYYNKTVINGKTVLAYNEVSTWLGKIKDSALVITDSYHCICFAILFEKPFLYYPNVSRGFTRLESLFSLLSIDMKSVVINPDNLNNISNRIITDYSEINTRLKDLRDTSKRFLIESLEK